MSRASQKEAVPPSGLFPLGSVRWRRVRRRIDPQPHGTCPSSVRCLERGLGAGLADEVSVVRLHEVEPRRGSGGTVLKRGRQAAMARKSLTLVSVGPVIT